MNLQCANTELFKVLADLNEKRDALSKLVCEEEGKLEELSNQSKDLAIKIQNSTDKLDDKRNLLSNYDALIRSTEGKYAEILGSSLGLLESVKFEKEQLLKNTI